MPPTLFIDRLSVTIPLDRDSDRKHEVHEAVNDSLHAWDQFITLEDPVNSRYRSKYKFTVEGGAKATLFLNPRNRSDNYFRLEYSPDRFGHAGRAILGEYLQEVMGDTYLDDLLEARLTRLDVAFDVRRVRLKDLLIVDLRDGKSAIIRGRDGQAESFYFPFDGTNQLCVYNKLQEIWDKQGTPPPPRPPSPWVRFEYRYRRLTNYTLGDIAGRLENPFNNFDVKRFGAAQADIDPDFLRMFFDGCRLTGVASVLEEVPDIATRESLTQAYQTFPIPNFWRRRTSIWGGLPTAVENALPR